MEHEALKHGWPLAPDAVIHSKPSYACAFDGKTRNPRWVLERLRPKLSMDQGRERNRISTRTRSVSWKHRRDAERRIAEADTTGDTWYAAADQKGSQEEMDATFALMKHFAAGRSWIQSGLLGKVGGIRARRGERIVVEGRGVRRHGATLLARAVAIEALHDDGGR